MMVLGINTGLAASHDVSACLVDGTGRVLAAIEEERLTRVRHAPSASPLNAVASCIHEAGISWHDVSHVAVGWDEPRLWKRAGRDNRTARDMLDELGAPPDAEPEVIFVPHHEAHAWSVAPLSPFDSCIVYVLDGNGEYESTSVFRYENGSEAPSLKLEARMPRASSLGYLFEATSEWLGLGRLASGKTMGLAAYGRDRELTWLDSEIVRWHPGEQWTFFGGDPKLDYDELQLMWSSAISGRFGGPMRRQDVFGLHRCERAINAAWAAQNTVEQAIGRLVSYFREKTGVLEACFAGGVALNCAATGRLSGPRFTPPWPHDGGVAIGAAWAVVRPRRALATPFLGPRPATASSREEDYGTVHEFDVADIADRLMARQIGAVCSGCSEFGPRALGNRSIIALPTLPEMQDNVNLRKGREPWRPFGPATTSTGSGLWEDISFLDKYMVGAAAMTDVGRRLLPAVAHVDGTTRPQAIDPSETSPFASIVLEMGRRGVPAVLNTSFNGPGEPIIQTATEALSAFRAQQLDFLVLDDKVVTT